MYPVDIAKVSAALGGAGIMGSSPDTVAALAAAVASGLPTGVVRALANHAASRDPEARRRIAALVVSPATMKRGARLSPAAGERAERLARVVALAQEVLDDSDEAETWLNQPHPLLGNARPIDVAATDLGARQVERILHDIEYFLPV